MALKDFVHGIFFATFAGKEMFQSPLTMNLTLYHSSVLLIFASAAVVFILLFFVTAPYGKFLRKGWGPSIKARLAWMIMEFPSPALMVYFFFTARDKNIVHYIFLISWLSHYLYRTFLYPFLQTGRDKPYPVLLVLMAFVFNCLNGSVNGYGVFHLYEYDNNWLLSWQFIAGFTIFICGFIVNKISDSRLMTMRKNNPGEYVIPEGWLFNYVSSPHYLGEIVEWSGWAIMTFSAPGLSFAVFTFANLFPRAIASHNWYKQNLSGYPPDRKAILPFII